MEFKEKRIQFSQQKRRFMREKTMEHNRVKAMLASHKLQSPNEIQESQIFPDLPILRIIISNQQQQIQLINRIINQQFQIDDYPQIIQTIFQQTFDNQYIIYEAIIGLRIILQQIKERQQLQYYASDFLNVQLIETLTNYLLKCIPHIQYEILRIFGSLSLIQKFYEVQGVQKSLCRMLTNVQISQPQVFLQSVWFLGNLLIDSFEYLLKQDNLLIYTLNKAKQYKNWETKQAGLWLSCIILSKINDQKQLIQNNSISNLIDSIINLVVPYNPKQSLIIYFYKFPSAIQQFICSMIYLNQLFPNKMIPTYSIYLKSIVKLINSVPIYEVILLARLLGVICYGNSCPEQYLTEINIIGFCEKLLDFIYPQFHYVSLTKINQEQSKNQKGKLLVLIEEIVWLLCNLGAQENFAAKIVINENIFKLMCQCFRQSSSIIIEMCFKLSNQNIDKTYAIPQLVICGHESLIKKTINILKYLIWLFSNLFQKSGKYDLGFWEEFFEKSTTLLNQIYKLKNKHKGLLGVVSLQNQMKECFTKKQFLHCLSAHQNTKAQTLMQACSSDNLQQPQI